jgi:hypothetical protein
VSSATQIWHSKHSPRKIPSNRRSVLTLFVIALVTKSTFLLIDPHPAFHFGDSGAYLATALFKWIPPDRSFTYGFFLRPLVLNSHLLAPVLFAQVTLSAIASALVGFLLLRYFGANFPLAAAFSFLCAVEPLQLMSERFIMTETLATFVFACFTWSCLAFLRTSKIVVLLLSQLLAVLLVSLRFSFLPLAVISPFVLPLLTRPPRSHSKLKPVLMNVVIAVLCSQALLFSYRHLYGTLAHTGPAYLSRDGQVLLADMAPLIRPSDFPIVKDRKRLFANTTIPLAPIDNRRFQRWRRGGICDSVLSIANGDEDFANQLAKLTALHAMKRDPLGALDLTFQTYVQFLSYQRLKWALALDHWGLMLRLGEYLPPSANDVTMIRRWFGIDPGVRPLDSLTKRWELLAAPWCSLIVLLPWLYAIEILFHRRWSDSNDIFLLFCAWSVLIAAIVPVEIANPRYLVPLPWLSVLMLGVWLSHATRRARAILSSSRAA